MTINACNEFRKLWNYFHDEPNSSGEYNFKDLVFKQYCPDENCSNDIDKFNAGCLWILNAFFGNFGISLNNDNYKDAVVCIMLWLSYKLSLKSHDGINTLKEFYSKHIETNEKYIVSKVYNNKFKGYKNIIDQIKEYLDIDISFASKFYELLKLLCSMDTAYTEKNSDKISENANKFIEKYQKLLDNDNNTEGSPYNKILFVLSNYYNNFDKYRIENGTSTDRPQLPTKKRDEHVEVVGSKEIKISESSKETGTSNIVTTDPSYDTTFSDSSLVSKLIPALSIFVAIGIFLGIAYKYSLFGFRKRSQKHLRKKLKK
ncbi:PIR protein [Plasmodium yoelii]|uniref:YIR protein n=1 Tax=Plasmodium yoelii TaxID=5861 RepID=A0A4V0KRB8_PLAYE|nr:PIR protein [Plasmodium yoelii]VTZ80403.1 PIR protein [Plasmodium yoelii]|eukprot:XP_022813466.1 PIR protein [Plasmodium yoelii]